VNKMNKCINKECKYYEIIEDNNCGILSQDHFHICKYYTPKPEPEYYKILVPKGVNFSFSFSNGKGQSISNLRLDTFIQNSRQEFSLSDELNIKCTLEKGDIENG